MSRTCSERPKIHLFQRLKMTESGKQDGIINILLDMTLINIDLLPFHVLHGDTSSSYWVLSVFLEVNNLMCYLVILDDIGIFSYNKGYTGYVLFEYSTIYRSSVHISIVN